MALVSRSTWGMVDQSGAWEDPRNLGSDRAHTRPGARESGHSVFTWLHCLVWVRRKNGERGQALQAEPVVGNAWRRALQQGTEPAQTEELEDLTGGQGGAGRSALTSSITHLHAHSMASTGPQHPGKPEPSQACPHGHQTHLTLSNEGGQLLGPLVHQADMLNRVDQGLCIVWGSRRQGLRQNQTAPSATHQSQ